MEVGLDRELVRSWSFIPIASSGFQESEVRFLQRHGEESGGEILAFDDKFTCR